MIANKNVKIIGVTGGIGSGKSRLVSYAARNYPVRVIEADEVGKELMEPGKTVYLALVAEYGDRILKEDGTLDREALSAICFENPETQKKVNEIEHPLIQAEIEKRIRYTRKPFVLLEAALLIEGGLAAICDEVVYVYSSPKARIRRLSKSRGYSEEKTRKIIDLQLSDEEFRKYATFVIDNSGRFAAAEAAFDDFFVSMGLKRPEILLPEKKLHSFVIMDAKNPLQKENVSKEDLQEKYLKYLAGIGKYYNRNEAAALRTAFAENPDAVFGKIAKAGDLVLKISGLYHTELPAGDESGKTLLFALNPAFDDAEVFARNYAAETFFYARINQRHTKYKICFFESKDCCETYDKTGETDVVLTNEKKALSFFAHHGLFTAFDVRDWISSVPELEESRFKASLDENAKFLTRASKRRGES